MIGWPRRSVITGLTAGLLSAPAWAQTPPPEFASPPVANPTDQNAEAVFAAAADRADRMTVPVMVNGLGPFPFVIDTGSNRTVISELLVQQLGLPMDAALQVRAATGIATAGSVRIGSLAVGKRADISAFSKDLMRVEPADILRATPTLTVTGGRITHQA